MSEYKETRFETSTHVITASNSHANMWVFSSKTNNTFFAITTTEQWICDNLNIIPYPEKALPRSRSHSNKKKFPHRHQIF